MSLLPALFRRGERMRPLGMPIRIEPTALAAPAVRFDWSFATKGDGAPKLVRLHLTAEAQAEADNFDEDRGCSCFQSAPCWWCTDPGNPRNQAEDDTAWVYGHESESDSGSPA